ncbi:hypothetical protein ORIO_04200 [Cereibacter azotoformans]|uniref:hypothetical protein n=1 Tax=Cereibacter azotoformans TaxID=43057 RepID=UPI001EEA8382|nr:hypothetical protein [Cereibacter azotoformans]ULB09129.1 hypothetical protein ORIO_04200 [Cereibacter azotoformans]
MLDALTLAPSAHAAAIEESPFRRLWREHEMIREAYDHSTLPDDHPAMVAGLDRMLAIEGQVARMKPATVEDVAILIMFADNRGDFENCSTCADAMLAFARDVTGEGVKA